MNAVSCEACNTPLDHQRVCITCRAREDGLALLTRSSYTAVKEMVAKLEEAGIAGEVEKVPPRREEELKQPLWNLYAPLEEAEQAVATLQRDWAELLQDPEAAAAAERGTRGVDLDAGGEVQCPACGHRFAASGAGTECPDCGLSLGAPTDAAPDEGAA
jgi:hypothetical protein